MEDYNADFLTMLETWEAAVEHSTSVGVRTNQPVEIDKLLGWTQDRTHTDKPQMNRTADTHKTRALDVMLEVYEKALGVRPKVTVS